jgi:PAS domain S-box-containing protein
LSRLALAFGLALLAVVGTTATGLVVATAQEEASGLGIALILVVAVAFVISGLVASERRPDNRTGVYLAAVGYLAFFSILTFSANEWLFAIGFAGETLLWVPFGALVLAFPTGQLYGRLERAIPVITGVSLTTGAVLVLLLDPTPAPSRCEGCPGSPVVLSEHPGLAGAIDLMTTVIGLGIIVLVLTLLVRRWREATPALRRLLWPVLAAGSATLLSIGLVVIADQFSDRVTEIFSLLLLIAFATVPLAFLLGILRMRLARSSIADVIVSLQRGTPLRDALARALADPSVEVVYRLDSSRGLGGAGWVDAEGRGVPAPAPSEGRAIKYVEQDDVCVAALIHDASLAEEPELVDAVTAAAGIALHNERLQAELRAEIRLAGVLADTTPGLLSNVDTEGRILKLNRATLRASGYSSDEELRGKYFWDVFIAPEEREEMIARFRAAAPAFPPAEYENEFTNARGERLVIFWRSEPVLDEHGRVVSIVAGGLDITERKARELEAELRRGFLDAITDAMPSFLIAVDPNGVVMEDGVNPAFTEAFGWSKDEMGGRSFLDLVASEYQYVDRMTIANAANGVVQAERESSWLPREGEPRIVAWSARPVLDPQGRNIVLVAGSDVTVRRRREEETRASEERFRAVVDSAPVAIIELGLDDTVKLWNPAAERIFGWAAEDVVGSEAPMVPAGARGEFETLVDRVRTGAGVEGYETVRVRRDGSPVAVAISTAPVHDARGEVISHMAVFSDISDRKRQEEELRASRARLVEAADDARRKLERNLHDGAQQRLVALSVSLRLAESKLRDDPETATSLLGGAREELTHALEDLRELARGIHPAVLTDRGLGAAVEALVARSPLPVEADVEQLPLSPTVEAAAYYVVAEALTNVVKYAHASSATVRIAREDGVLAVTVGDDGIGGADPADGSGLRGLADRVAALDGSLSVASPEGGGTAVRAEIPLRGDGQREAT